MQFGFKQINLPGLSRSPARRAAVRARLECQRSFRGHGMGFGVCHKKMKAENRCGGSHQRQNSAKR